MLIVATVVACAQFCYFKVIIECSKQSDLKSKIEIALKQKILFTARAYIINYKSKISTIKLIILTDTKMQFIEVIHPDEPRRDWDLEKFICDFDYDIKFDDIELIFTYDYLNRITIQYKEGLIGILFQKSDSAAVLMETTRLSLNIEKITRFIKIFENDDSEKIEIKENETADESKTGNEKKEVISSISEEENIIFLCQTKITSFFDIFKFLFHEKEIIEGSKIVVIQGEKLSIYKEKYDDLLEIDFKTVMDNPKQVQNCYKKLIQYDLNELTHIKFYESDEVLLEISNYTLNMKIFDDISYVKFKKALVPFIKNLQIVSNDDMYDNIK